MANSEATMNKKQKIPLFYFPLDQNHPITQPAAGKSSDFCRTFTSVAQNSQF